MKNYIEKRDSPGNPKRVIFSNSDENNQISSHPAPGGSILFKISNDLLQEKCKDMYFLIDSVKNIFLTTPHPTKEIILDFTAQAEMVKKALDMFLSIRGSIQNKFDIILTQRCKILIKIPDASVKALNIKIMTDNEMSEKKQGRDIFDIFQKMAMSRQVSFLELKIYTYLFGKSLKSKITENPSYERFSYEQVSEALGSFSTDKKTICKSIDHLKKRRLISVSTERDGLKYFRPNVEGPINFGDK